MFKKINVTRLEQTLTSCPTQFEGESDHGSIIVSSRCATLTIMIEEKIILLLPTIEQEIDYRDIVKATQDMFNWPPTLSNPALEDIEVCREVYENSRGRRVELF